MLLYYLFASFFPIFLFFLFCFVFLFFFFFQAEDGIRDPLVTGVQTCGLPISDGFLKDQEMIDPNGHYTPTTVAHIYNMALAGLCAISQNDKTTAQLIGDKLQALSNKDFTVGPDRKSVV